MHPNRVPSLNWLRVFAAAARCESFAKAANELHMSTPAVSQQIRALESHLQKPLFDRGAHSVRLTDAGKAYCPVVQQALHSIDATTNALFGGAHSAPLTVQVNYIFACSWLAPRLKLFQSSYPEIQLQLQTGNHAEDFHPDIAELQIKLGSQAEAIQEGDPLCGECLYPVACPEIARKIKTSSNLLDYLLIEIIKHPKYGWIQLLEDDHDIDWQGASFHYVDTSQMAMAMAGSGFGIALARSPVTDSLLSLYNLQPCLDDLKIDSGLFHYLAYPNRESLTAPAQVFRQWLLARISENE